MIRTCFVIPSKLKGIRSGHSQAPRLKLQSVKLEYKFQLTNRVRQKRYRMIYGKTDADAVFGLLYAQCEDDFNRVEQNYIWATGRLAEVEGEEALYSDLVID